MKKSNLIYTPEKTRYLMKERGICVIIPTFNNAQTLRQVLMGVIEYCDDVIVVNDGSTDRTSEILKDFPYLTVLDYPCNRGKGYALKTGLGYARQKGFAYAITMDSDGQHYAHDIPHFVMANQQYPGALIVGARQMQGVDRSKGSSFANQFSNFWFWIQTGQKLSDTQTGFRLYPIKKLKGLNLLTSRYESELELLVFASWHGVELHEIPIDVYYPPREERVSHFRPYKDFGRITVLNSVLCFLAVVYGLPLRVFRGLMTVLRTLYAIFVFFFFAFVVVTPLVMIYLKLGKVTPKKRIRIRELMYQIARVIVVHHGIPGVKFSSKMSENIDFEKAHVIICNHQSHLDTICQLIFTPRIVFLCNDWVYNNPSYGYLIRHAEYLPASKGIDALLPQLRDLVSRGYSIAVYPEGTRSKDCSIGRFHQGAFYMADILGVDIIPMMLYGPGKVLPKKTYHLRKGPIHVEMGDPISRDELQAMGDWRAQAKEMRRRYKEIYEHLSNQIEQNV